MKDHYTKKELEQQLDYLGSIKNQEIKKLEKENAMLTGVLADYLDRETIEKYKKELK